MGLQWLGKEGSKTRGREVDQRNCRGRERTTQLQQGSLGSFIRSGREQASSSLRRNKSGTPHIAGEEQPAVARRGSGLGWALEMERRHYWLVRGRSIPEQCAGGGGGKLQKLTHHMSVHFEEEHGMLAARGLAWSHGATESTTSSRCRIGLPSSTSLLMVVVLQSSRMV